MRGTAGGTRTSATSGGSTVRGERSIHFLRCDESPRCRFLSCPVQLSFGDAGGQQNCPAAGENSETRVKGETTLDVKYVVGRYVR